jgi:hypothetical protein
MAREPAASATASASSTGCPQATASGGQVIIREISADKIRELF